MNRENEAAVIEFCARQYENFNSADWLAGDLLPADEMATVALFLAGAQWYGHEPFCHRDSLTKIAEHLHPGSAGHFVEMMKKVDFDPSRFANMLRRRINQ